MALVTIHPERHIKSKWLSTQAN